MSKGLYFSRLDGLRAIGALLVIWSHFPVVKDNLFSKYFMHGADLFGAGYLGVDIFFVLSGFLITRILLGEKNKTGKISYKAFILKRALRIFPIYYAAIIFCFIAYGSINNDTLSALFYVSNYHFSFDETGGPLRHTWSLAVEEQFYLFWPFVVLFFGAQAIKRFSIYALPVILVVVAIVMMVAWDSYYTERLLYRATFFRMLSLCLGAVIAINFVSNKSVHSSDAYIGLAASMILLGVTYIWEKFDDSGFSSISKMFGFSILSYTIVLVTVYSIKLFNFDVSRILEWRVLKSIGTVSYGVYLYHAIILWGMGISHYQVGSTSADKLFIALGLTFLVAYLSYYLVEIRFIRLKERILG